MTGTRPPAAVRSLYRMVLGAAWETLDVRLRRFCELPGTWRGTFKVRTGGCWAQLAGRLLRLPRASDSAPSQLVIEPQADCERWHRRIGEHQIDTEQLASGSLLVERIGVIELR